MKLSCLQENLARSLALVSRAVPTRSTLPVVNNVLLACEASRLKLSATNLEIAITTWTGAKIEEEGAITVPARLLTEFVNSLGPDRIDMTLNPRNRALKISCQRYEAEIKGIDADEFPPVPKPEDGITTTVEAQALQEAIHQVVFATATDDTRPVLAGVNAIFEGDTLTLAAADGFRLAVRKLPLEKPVERRQECIIPARALSELARIISDDVERVEIILTPGRGQTFFSLGDVELVSRLIEGAFPNYQQIIPVSHKTRLTLD
ncbi:MAG: DNA polymerase III subunit beta, partial [Chloroflexi bacterium]|nr:DNA polymerase III subunit beta [Chloroflexota bacterium]